MISDNYNYTNLYIFQTIIIFSIGSCSMLKYSKTFRSIFVSNENNLKKNLLYILHKKIDISIIKNNKKNY